MQYEPLYYLQKYKRPLLLWGSILLSCLMIVGIALWQQSLESRKGKIAVAITTAPSNAVIRINGSNYGQGTYYLPEGIYTVRIEKDGFHTATQQLRVNAHSLPAVYAGLSPKTPEAKAWYQRHKAQYAAIEKHSFAQSQAYGEAFKRRWPIVSSLPLRDPYFTIGYKNIDDKDILLTIKATSPRYRELALDQLRKKGFEPTDYHIEFIGFKNPLGESS